jgi:D-alanine-D-alanine ligase
MDIAAPDFIGTISTGGYDVAFVALHGKYGEDGSIQGLLDILHIPYTFSGVLASAMAMETDVAKAVYRREGIPVADDVTLHAGEVPTDEELAAMVDRLGLPLFVKPAGNGSSFGITRVVAADELRAAVELAMGTGTSVLIESAIEGTEITVPVLGNDDAHALPIIQINTGADFYDIKVKYEPSELHHVIPARINEESYARAQELAVAAHRALGCRGCSRSDFIVREDGTPVILETNTIPGMTSASLLPDSARHGGMEFPDLCKHFVELALEDVR